MFDKLENKERFQNKM
jgi:hypothetical protein